MHPLLWTAALGFLAAAPLPALAQESAERGREIATRWCADCHLAAPGQTRALADAPTFSSIAAGSEGDYGWLPAFLADPHPAMPEMSLTRQQIRDLAAYLATLRE